jgi:hypothetical protein
MHWNLSSGEVMRAAKLDEALSKRSVGRVLFACATQSQRCRPTEGKISVWMAIAEAGVA